MDEKVFYETIHKASGQNPYIDLESENIQYLSHFHEEIEMIYVLEGSVDFCVNGNTTRLTEGQIGFVMPGDIHSLFSQSSRLHVMKFAQPGGDKTLSFSTMRFPSCVITKENPIYKEAQGLILEIAQEARGKAPGYRLIQNSCAQRLLVLLLRKMDYGSISIDEKKKMKHRLLLLETVNRYIEEHHVARISLEEIAKACNLSLYYFSHMFKELSGMSFGTYLTVYRLERAVEKMQSTDEKLTNIAFSSGFSNIRSFNRLFQKQFGVTPSQYKKTLKK